MPWWVYEPRPHYRRGYIKHLWLNLKQMFVWATCTETELDREFERNINASWTFVLSKMFRFQKHSKCKLEFNYDRVEG